MVYLSRKFIENCWQVGRGRIIPAFVLLFLLGLTACREDNDDELYRTSANITFEIETSMASYDSINYDATHLRVIIEAVSLDGKTTKRDVSTSEHQQQDIITMSMTLPEDKYNVRIWCDFVPSNSSADHHFDTGRLHLGFVSHKGKYNGNTSKTAYGDYLYLDLEKVSGTNTYRVSPKAATGRFSLIPSDMESHIGDSVEITFSYAGYFPLSYNVDKQLASANGLTPGVGFGYREKVERDKIIGIDDIFVCDTETILFADIQTKDSGGKIIGNTRVRIPIYRGMNTILRCNLFTVGPSNGGIGVNDKFDDEIIVEVQN